MKNKLFIAFFVAIAVTFGFLGCANPNEAVVDPIIGKWAYSGMSSFIYYYTFNNEKKGVEVKDYIDPTTDDITESFTWTSTDTHLLIINVNDPTAVYNPTYEFIDGDLKIGSYLYTRID